MLTQRQLFFKHLAQTSDIPLSLEIVQADGVYLFDNQDKKYLDLIAGISVSNTGHRHPAVIRAIREQTDKYLYLMVYGEYVQSSQVQLAKRLAELLPAPLDNVYFVNSGTEATEGALKLAKRHTGRTEMTAFRNAYHGSTHGALSVMGNEYFKNAFRPLLPDIRILEFNNTAQLQEITDKTACVITEPIQAEAGIIEPTKKFMNALRQKCNETGVLLIFDEIQTGFGRTGKLFGFEHYDIIPDIILFAKGLGGGMPLGAFISSGKIMQSLSYEPVLGHITTFGGHPVSCAAALANINVIIGEKLVEQVAEKEKLFLDNLKGLPLVKNIRSKGLMMAIDFDSFETNKKVINACIRNGVITDWFLFSPHSMRIAPPLIIKKDEIIFACRMIKESILEIANSISP